MRHDARIFDAGLGYKDRSKAITGLGVFLLLVGMTGAILGPIEMYCFYLFSEGGSFYFEGFGLGSLVFASIAWQIIGYYLIAIVCIPVGLGHIRRWLWAKTVALAGIGAWNIVGIPLTLVTLFFLLTYKELNIAGLFLILGTVLLLYPGLPFILIRFYKSRDVQLTFTASDSKSCWTEKFPLPVLTLVLLLCFYWLAGHVPIFFRGVFPFFGFFLDGLPGITLATAILVSLLFLLWGVLRLKTWSWWGTFILLWTVIATITLTLLPLSFLDIVSAMQLPSIEMQAMQGIPLLGWHIALFLDVPLLVTIRLLVKVKPYFLPNKGGDL